MSTFKDSITKDLTISESSSIQGHVEGRVTVLPNQNLQVHGRILGELKILQNAECSVHGVIKGNVLNEGLLHVYGTIEGKIITGAKAKTILGSKAKVTEP